MRFKLDRNKLWWMSGTRIIEKKKNKNKKERKKRKGKERREVSDDLGEGGEL